VLHRKQRNETAAPLTGAQQRNEQIERLMSMRLMVSVRGVIAMTSVIALLTLALPGDHDALGDASAPANASTAAAVRPLTSILGVLRRPQSAADRNPALVRQLQHYYHHNEYDSLRVGLDGLRVLSLTRLATVAPWGQRVYIVPFLPPTAAQKRRLPGKWRTAATQTTATLAVYPMSGEKITAFIEDAPDQAFIKGGRAIGNGAYDTKVYDHPRQVIMFVPDGVAKVALWYPNRSIANHPEHPVTAGSKPVIVNVHDNIAALLAPGRFERRHRESVARPGQEIWYGPNGNVVEPIDSASSCGPPLGRCA
jgi:hypothetical protein